MLLQLSQSPPICPSLKLATLSHSPSPHRCSWQWVRHVCSLSNPFTLFQPIPTSSLPSYSCQSVPRFCAFDSILIIYLFCSLDSSYKWDHSVFVLHWLAYFNEHNSLHFHPCCHKRQGFLLFYCHLGFHCVNVPQLFYPLSYWWALRLFPNLGYCK